MSKRTEVIITDIANYFQSVYYRTMDIPEDLEEELSATGVFEVFSDLPPSHQAEYIWWIESAKKPETRQSRIVKTCEMVAEKSGL